MVRILLFVFMLTGCIGPQTQNHEASIASTTFHYSGFYSLKIPTAALAHAKILNVNGPVIVFEDGKSLSGLVITHELESLPQKFDLAKYPKYVLGLEKIVGLDNKLKGKFINSAKELEISLNSPIISVDKLENKILYSACGARRCSFFIVMDSQKEQIFMLTSRGFDKAELIDLIIGK